MMKHYSEMCRRGVVAFVLAFMTFVSAFAGDNKYYYFYATAKANPTGQGKVYLAEANNTSTPVYEDEVELKFVPDVVGINTSTVLGYAEPAEGYLLAGWSTTTDKVEKMGNPGHLSITALTSTDENQEPDLDFGFPIEPDAEFYALFTRVMVSYVPGQETLGTIACSKVCNEIGDEVELTATPIEDSRFAYWTLNGEKITDNPLKVKVAGPANYVAHFECDRALNLTFPEEGGYMPFSSKYTAMIPEGMTVHSIYSNDLYGNPVLEPDRILTTESYYQLVGGDAGLLYAKGECTLMLEEVDDYSRVDEENLLKYSGANGVKMDTLNREKHRYFIFKDDKFVHSTDAFVEPYSLYLAVPDSCGQTADVLTIVTGSEYADGIDEVLADGKDAARNARVKGIYDLTGRRVALPGKEGIYIIDGKKVLFRVK